MIECRSGINLSLKAYSSFSQASMDAEAQRKRQIPYPFKVEFRAWSIEQPTSTEEPPKPKLRFLSFAFPNNKTKIQRGLLRDPQVGNHNQASKSRSCASCLLHFPITRRRFKGDYCVIPKWGTITKHRKAEAALLVFCISSPLESELSRL